MGILATDEELFSLAEKELFTCVIGDVMDKMHMYHQFLPPQIMPLDRSMVPLNDVVQVL